MARFLSFYSWIIFHFIYIHQIFFIHPSMDTQINMSVWWCVYCLFIVFTQQIWCAVSLSDKSAHPFPFLSVNIVVWEEAATQPCSSKTPTKNLRFLQQASKCEHQAGHFWPLKRKFDVSRRPECANHRQRLLLSIEKSLHLTTLSEERLAPDQPSLQ